MSETTKRTVETEFTARDAGYSASLGKITSAFESGWKKLEQGRTKLGEFRREQGMTTLAALGVGYGIGSWVEKIKEAQTEFTSTKKGIAGILSSSLAFKKGTSEIETYNRSLVLSDGITRRLDDDAARFNMQLGDVSNAYRTVSTSAGALGITQGQVMGLTEASIATAKRFGVDGERAATAIARALQMGAVKGFEPFDIKLRNTLGNMKKLTQAQRFDHIQKALKGSMDIADAMSGGIGGALTRARHVVNDLIRDATGPLFKEISKSLESWSKHIREAAGSARPLVEIFSDKLVKAFHVLQAGSAFLHEHWGAIAVIMASMKFKELATGMSTTMLGLSGMGGGLGGAAGAVGGALGQMASKILPVVGALGALQVAISGLADFISDRIAKSMDAEQRAHSVAGTFGIVKKLSDLGVLSADQTRIAGRQLEDLRRGGIVHGNKIDRAGLTDAVRAMTLERRESLINDMGIKHKWLPQGQLAGQPEYVAEQLAARFGEFIARYAAAPGATAGDQGIKFAKQTNNFYGGIHVTQKFEEADPDRVFLRFQTDVEREATHRTQSIIADPQGF